MDHRTWERWNNRWEWTRKCVLRKGCEDFKIEISDPIPMESVERFENETGLALPEDYKIAVTQFGSSVEFDWYLKKDCPDRLPEDHPKVQAQLALYYEAMGPEDFEEVRKVLLEEISKKGEWIEPPTENSISFGGTGAGPMWESERDPLKSYRLLQQAIRDMNPDNEMSEADLRECEGFYPIMGLGDGDTVAMDLKSNPTRILHLDHEGSYLGDAIRQIDRGFEGFMTRFSRLGCPGPDSGHFMKFVSKRRKVLDLWGMNSREWVGWFESRNFLFWYLPIP